MGSKYLLFALVALVLTSSSTFAADADNADMEHRMEDSTESPVADLAVLDSQMKTSTERPTTATIKAQAAAATKSEQPQNAQPHTVADFIIHPLIAFKPRSPEEGLAGKQAGDSSTTTTPSPWTLFGFNAGQGLGSTVSSSVSSLAGSVSGWLTDRIQLPGLVDSPIRDSSTTSTTTTTTTTQRPDIVVRVQHKGSTRRPLISITNENRPHRFYSNNNNNLNVQYDDELDDDLDDPLEEEEEIIKNKNRRRNNKNNNNRRRPNREEEEIDDDEDEEEEDIRPVRRPQQNRPQRRRRPIVEDDISEEEVEDNDDGPQSDEFVDDEDEEVIEDDEEDENVENDENDEEEEPVPQNVNTRRRPVQYNGNNRPRQQPQRRRLIVGSQRQQPSSVIRRITKPIESEDDEDDGADEHFYYSSRPSTKRSQNDATLFRRGQDNVIKQIRQLTGGHTPAEIGALLSTSPAQTGSKQNRRRTTLFVNRNGQTYYLAPELLNNELPQVHQLKEGATKFPQPPLTVPLKRKNAPTQYITIPWSQLGITQPNNLHSVVEGVQSQPLILNIPASAIQAMQNQSSKRKKQPAITSEAVPLLAEASIMDVFKPPKIPHDRHSMDASVQKPATGGMPVIIASKKKKNKPASSSNAATTATNLPQRIRPGTVVEKSPATADVQPEAAEEMSAQEAVHNGDNEYILVGEDNEPSLTQQVQPVYGEARYVYGANGSPYFEVLKNGRVAQLRRSGRELEVPAAGEPNLDQLQPVSGEQFIPVKVISEPEESAPAKDLQVAVEAQPQKIETKVGQAEAVQTEVEQKALEGADVPVKVTVEENKTGEGAVATA
ncbi:probable serine/threonine-protein kinase kinX [Rhagoletis pomonella]|uniref:probable serine/threonine-protein kinase kinX n=1 Tax=Rhagoletis pomonella TaxID=28610 RepID=UPI0017832FBF|nr:probable serine/threonine-protein kinase kinX [Rhagoletis pomonella]